MTPDARQYIPLVSAYLCQDCDSVGNSSMRCPACASEVLMGLAGVFDRKEEVLGGEDAPVFGAGCLDFAGISSEMAGAGGFFASQGSGAKAGPVGGLRAFSRRSCRIWPFERGRRLHPPQEQGSVAGNPGLRPPTTKDLLLGIPVCAASRRGDRAGTGCVAGCRTIFMESEV